MTAALVHRRLLPATDAPKFGAKLLAAALLVVVADLLFYERVAGISLPLFLALIAATLLATSLRRKHLATSSWAALVLCFGLLPLAENVSVLSMALGFGALAVFSLAVTGRLRRSLARIVWQIAGFLLAVAFRFVPDMVRWRVASRKVAGRLRLSGVASWVLPVGLGLVFVLLFGIANPIVEKWLDMISLWRLFDLLDAFRTAFWMLVLMVVWGFLRPRVSWFQLRRPPVDLIGPVKPREAGTPGYFFDAMVGEVAILRALVIFNALFAVETVLDIAYLWSGVALPDGMTYAAYAHRGAYPLIVTALLAAAFVLVATREGGKAGRNPLVRVLVYVWTAQNIMLVIFSILRLDLYIDVYSLTYWRVAAFIWMGLVAVGLVLIIVRIATGRSNDWLLSANLATLGVTLYACGFVNFAGIIAEWNVDHRPPPDQTSIFLDTYYLTQLGPEAIPAIDRLLAAGDTAWPIWISEKREEMAAAHLQHMQDWRSWTFRGWRLMRYLDQHPAMIGSEGQGEISGE